jgi:predicted PurR-regulated permease PerM
VILWQAFVGLMLALFAVVILSIALYFLIAQGREAVREIRRAWRRHWEARAERHMHDMVRKGRTGV